MLTQIRIRDLVLIDELDLDLSPGFNVLTGETGTGKSLVATNRGVVTQHDTLRVQGIMNGAEDVIPNRLEAGREQLHHHMVSVSVNDQGREAVTFGMYDPVRVGLWSEVPAP